MRMDAYLPERFANSRLYESEADYAIVGPSDNRVHEIRTKRFPYNTICHLGRDFGDGKWHGCSGVLIGPNRVLTAGHCLFSHKRGKAPVRIRVSPGRRDRDTFPYGSIVSKRFYVPRDYVKARGVSAKKRKLFDYGIIVLPRRFPGIKKFMTPTALTAPELDVVRRSNVISIGGYPGDRPIGSQWRHSEKLTKYTPRRLLYTVDTCPGHSGSPIWCRSRNNRYRIIGVHTSGIVDEFGRSYGCSKRSILAPPGRFNSGIRLTREVLRNIKSPTVGSGSKAAMQRLP